MQIYNCITSGFLLQYRTLSWVCAMRPNGKEEKSFPEGTIMNKTILIIILLSVVRAAIASERLVPSQYPTIQAAINAADNSGTVTVEANTFGEENDVLTIGTRERLD